MKDERLNILSYDSVRYDEEKNALVILDQTQLPNDIEILYLDDKKEIFDAIYFLKVRGAPAIGVAAAIGIYVLAKKIDKDNFEDFYAEFKEIKDYLNSSRPTAVNLSWALGEIDKVVVENKDKEISVILEEIKKEALKIREDDIAVCKKIGEYGLTLLKKNAGLLTHCNAGQLATIKYGTATSPMYLGHEQGYNFKIFCDETRPLLQGARLTSFELFEAGMDVTVICDSMAAIVMKKGLVDAVLVGTDRVAANGDIANKIGTLPLSIVANRYNVPVYVCAPTSTIDLDTKTGDDIEIEERKSEEITSMWYKKPMVREGIKTFNPAFDVTDNELISAIVTERGIVYPPYNINLKKIMEDK